MTMEKAAKKMVDAEREALTTIKKLTILETIRSEAIEEVFRRVERNSAHAVAALADGDKERASQFLGKFAVEELEGVVQAVSHGKSPRDYVLYLECNRKLREAV